MWTRLVFVAEVLVACSVLAEPPFTTAAPSPPGAGNSWHARQYYEVDTRDWGSKYGVKSGQNNYYSRTDIFGREDQDASSRSGCRLTPNGTVCDHDFAIDNRGEVTRGGRLLSRRVGDADGKIQNRYQHNPSDDYARGKVHVENRAYAGSLETSTQAIADLRGMRDGLDRLFAVLNAGVARGDASAVKRRYSDAKAAVEWNLGQTNATRIAADPSDRHLAAAMQAVETMATEINNYGYYHQPVSEPETTRVRREAIAYQSRVGGIRTSLSGASTRMAKVREDLDFEDRINSAGNSMRPPAGGYRSEGVSRDSFDFLDRY